MKRCLFLLCCCIPCFSHQQSNSSQNNTLPTIKQNTQPIDFIYQLKYAPDITIINLLKKLTTKNHDKSLQIVFDKRTRQVFLEGKIKAINSAKQWLSHLDVPSKQIIVNAKIIDVDRNYLNNLGVSISRDKNPTSSSIVIPIFTLHQQNILNLRIHMLAEHGHAEILANPMLLTLNQSTAKIETGTEIPYQEKTKRGDISIAFKKATLSLQITPTVLSGDKLLLSIKVHHDIPSKLTIKGEPAIKTQQLATRVIIKNGQTVILGGIINRKTLIDTHAIPILHNIPIIGKLFENKNKSTRSSELLLIITPHLVTNTPQHQTNTKIIPTTKHLPYNNHMNSQKRR